MGLMATRAELKNEVKDAFRGNWKKAIGLSIIPIVFTVITVFTISAFLITFRMMRLLIQLEMVEPIVPMLFQVLLEL